MPRRSISLTESNDDWLNAQIESRAFTSKSEVVNDLIRRARKTEYVRAKLVRAEQGGFTEQTAAEILAEIKEEARRSGDG